MLERILGSNLCDKGSPFHTEGPTTENARTWVVEVRAKGTKSNPCSDERSELRPLVPRVGMLHVGIRPWINPIVVNPQIDKILKPNFRSSSQLEFQESNLLCVHDLLITISFADRKTSSKLKQLN